MPITLDDPVREQVAKACALSVRDIPAGHQIGNADPVPTVDFSGWLLFVRDDFPDDWAYALAQACDETRGQVDALPDLGNSLVRPIDPVSLFTETVVPLHPGALRYAEEHGFMVKG